MTHGHRKLLYVVVMGWRWGKQNMWYGCICVLMCFCVMCMCVVVMYTIRIHASWLYVGLVLWFGFLILRLKIIMKHCLYLPACI